MSCRFRIKCVSLLFHYYLCTIGSNVRREFMYMRKRGERQTNSSCANNEVLSCCQFAIKLFSSFYPYTHTHNFGEKRTVLSAARVPASWELMIDFSSNNSRARRPSLLSLSLFGIASSFNDGRFQFNEHFIIPLLRSYSRRRFIDSQLIGAEIDQE
jgi:hypothetical protein